jgi:hypothetical protein
MTNNSVNCQKILEYTLKYNATNATNANTNISDIYIILIMILIITLIIITDHYIDYNNIKRELDDLKKQLTIVAISDQQDYKKGKYLIVSFS